MAVRRRTVSVGVCASALENAQSELLAALLAAQVARACAVFRADEVVVVDDVAPAGAAGFNCASDRKLGGRNGCTKAGPASRPRSRPGQPTVPPQGV